LSGAPELVALGNVGAHRRKVGGDAGHDAGVVVARKAEDADLVRHGVTALVRNERS